MQPLAWAYLAALGLTMVSGGRPYYPLPLAAALMVAGTVAWTSVAARPRRTERAPHRSMSPQVHLLALPLLAARTVVATPIPALNDTLVETIGWPELTAQVADVVATPASPSEREDVVLLTGSYGEAGALDRYGPALGLPGAVLGTQQLCRLASSDRRRRHGRGDPCGRRSPG